MELKKKEVKGSVLIDLGPNGTLPFDFSAVHISEFDERDMTLVVVDKGNSNNRITMSFEKQADPELIKRKELMKQHAASTLQYLKALPDDVKKELQYLEELSNYVLGK